MQRPRRLFYSHGAGVQSFRPLLVNGICAFIDYSSAATSLAIENKFAG
jgi:hypothetical protein